MHNITNIREGQQGGKDVLYHNNYLFSSTINSVLYQAAIQIKISWNNISVCTHSKIKTSDLLQYTTLSRFCQHLPSTSYRNDHNTYLLTYKSLIFTIQAEQIYSFYFPISILTSSFLICSFLFFMSALGPIGWGMSTLTKCTLKNFQKME